MSSPQRGLYGSDIGANMLRAGTADVFGTFLLVFTGTAVAVAGALSRAIAGQPADSLAVAVAFGLVLVALVTALGTSLGPTSIPPSRSRWPRPGSSRGATPRPI